MDYNAIAEVWLGKKVRHFNDDIGDSTGLCTGFRTTVGRDVLLEVQWTRDLNCSHHPEELLLACTEVPNHG